MDRASFRQMFGTHGSVVLPVIHVRETHRTLRNLDIAVEEGAPGVFLINHDFGVPPFLDILREVRAARPDVWLGVNFLAVTGREAFPQLAVLTAEGCRIDAYWADDARIDERAAMQTEAAEIAAARAGWDGLYFGGTAFKKQRPVASEDHATSARIAADWMDVVTTSGIATGEEADDGKVATFRTAIGDAPLALASGVTPDNAHRYAAADCFMVATGINHPGNFYDMDPARLRALLQVARTLKLKGDRT
ncbi:BtpA/SgcQ family protein [Pseudaestuariivita sp.]|uniref:BtpA/SgcQ family protein n=1 Tax=Pseudaestuariivita sp. TaxID=2211669 RepID=UPI0040594A88